MLLKAIEISGFKSFARDVKMNFTFAVTAIVGPNGSGKSNVAEAFRFVLGEQSKKNMRSKNATDLIWAGSKEKPASSRARVKLVFDNSAKRFDYDFDQIELERALNADGASEYYINGSKVKLKEVQMLLASVGLGASSHHIISQGQADKIISATAKERLEIIKDSLGLNKYFLRKKEAVHNLEKTRENIKEIRLQMREVKPHLKYLQEQVDKLSKIDKTKEDLLHAYGNYIVSLQQEIAGTQDALQMQEQTLTDRKNIIEKDLKTHHPAPPVNENLSDARCDELNAELERAQKHIGDLQKEIGIKEGQLELLGTQKKQKESDKVVLVGGALSKAKRAIKSLQQAIEQADYDAVFNEAKNTTYVLSKIFDGTSAEKDADFDDATIKDELLSLKEELGKQQEIYAMLKRKLLSLQKKKDEENLKQREAQTAYFEKEKQLAEVDFELAKLKDKKMQIKIKKQEVSDMLADARLELDNLYHKLLEIIKTPNNVAGQRVSRFDIEKLRARLDELGSVGEDEIKEYERLQARMDFFDKELDDMKKSELKTRDLLDSLEKDLQADLDHGFKKISNEFNSFFQQLFGGGEAKLSLQHGQEGIEGVDIEVEIPGKKLCSLNSMSGGERSLVSIALIFAISQVSPPPFIILDETDAALDEANSRKYSDILNALSVKSQLITITHNRQTMSIAGELYGVTMGKDAISQVFSVSLQEAEAVAK